MKRTVFAFLCLAIFLCGCSAKKHDAQIVATTRPVYDFSSYLCQGTDLTVDRLITESVSCLHDYSLQVRQMRAIEAARVVVISGAGLEDFLGSALQAGQYVIDASADIPLLCGDHHHDHEHHHHHDPHIWLDAGNARSMAQSICQGLTEQFPQYSSQFQQNLQKLMLDFDALDSYCQQTLSNLSCRKLVTFHDGFAYFAQYCDLELLRAIEEEAGSEASAAELKELIQLVRQHKLPAVFTEENGSVSAAAVITGETGIKSYALNMAMSDKGYFEAMYHNIDTIREALQ